MYKESWILFLCSLWDSYLYRDDANLCGPGRRLRGHGRSANSGETVWQIVTVDGTTASKTSSGRTTVAAGNTDIFDFMAFCKPSDSKITVRFVDMCTQTVLVNNVEKSSNLPVGTTPLYLHAEVRNSAGGAGSAVAIFLNRLYLETDV